MDMVSLYLDYCSGMKIREMVRKYHMSATTIQWKCKKITIEIYTKRGYFIKRNIEKIKNDVRVAAQVLNTCPHCGHEINGGSLEEKNTVSLSTKQED
jgi:hypothetical protein